MGKGLAATIAIARWVADISPIDTVRPISAAAVALLTLALLAATVCTTWLRAAAAPFAIAGLLLLRTGATPDLLVSEDGRLVGLAVDGGSIALNRKRPNRFTLENWQRALTAPTIVEPATNPEPGGGEIEPVLISNENRASGAGSGFVCGGGACAARHASGARVVHAADRTAAMRSCGKATVIIVNDATSGNPCRMQGTLVVTKRDLALGGSAAITFTRKEPVGHNPGTPDRESWDGAQAQQTAAITHAIRRPYRPWHEHRRFSREARGLAPYTRSKPSTPRPSQKAGAAGDAPAQSIQ